MRTHELNELSIRRKAAENNTFVILKEAWMDEGKATSGIQLNEVSPGRPSASLSLNSLAERG